MLNRINLILKAKNITSKQFAEEIGVQPSGLSHILSGRNNPSLDFVMKVIRRYPEIDIHWLMFGTGEMYEQHHIHPMTPAMPATPATAPSAPSVSGELDLFSQMDDPVAGSSSRMASAQRPAEVSAPAVAPKDEPGKSPVVIDAAPAETAPSSVSSLKNIETKSGSNAIGDAFNNSQNNSAESPRLNTEKPIKEESAKIEAATPTNVPFPPAENPKNEIQQAPLTHFPTTSGHKKIVKMIVLYDDKSFSEYFPE